MELRLTLLWRTFALLHSRIASIGAGAGLMHLRNVVDFVAYIDCLCGPAFVTQWANTLAELQCGPGWLAQRRGFDSRCRHVKSGFCML